MKHKTLGYLLLPALLAAGNAQAQTIITRADNAIALTVTGNPPTGAWVGGVVPTSTTAFARFDSTTTNATNSGNQLVGGSFSAQGLIFANPTVGANGYVFNFSNSGARLITLGANTAIDPVLLDMSNSSVNVTLGATSDTANGNYRVGGIGALTHNIGAGTTFTLRLPYVPTNGNAGFTTASNASSAQMKYINFTGTGSAVLNTAFHFSTSVTDLSTTSNPNQAYMGLAIAGTNVTLNAANRWLPVTTTHAAGNAAIATGSMKFEISSGTLNLGNNDALQVDSRITNASTRALPFSFKGGAVTASGADRTISTAGGFAFDGSTTFSGSNSLTLNSSATQASSSTLTNSLDSGKVLTLAQTVSLSNNATDRTLTITGAGETVISGAIANGGTSTISGLTKSGLGTLTLSNTGNSFTGPLTINAGTVQLGASGVVADTAGLVLNGGTFDLNGFNESLGSLTVSASSTVSIGSSSVSFLDSSSNTWSGSLSISGTLLATSVRFGTTSTALTSLQQQAILVNGLGGYALDSSGFLVSAIPEPSSFAVVAGFAGLSLASLRRRRASVGSALRG
jgi:fibronectin-binding autotransporter adhesin